MSEEIKKITDGINEIKDSIDGKLEIAKKEMGDEFKKNFKAELEAEIKSVTSRQDELESLYQKGLETSKPKGFVAELDEQLKSDEKFKAFKSGDSARASLSIKADMTTSGNASGESAIAYRRGGIVYDPSRPIHIRSIATVLPTGQTNSVRHIQENSFTDNAATRAESAAYAQSEFVLGVVDTSIRSIGHRIDLPVEMFEDIAGLPAYINSRLPEKLMEEEDAQLLYGDNSAPNLKGWMTSAGVSSFASTIAMADLVDSAQRYDVIVGAINEVFIRHYAPTAVVVNPTDYHTMLLLKDTTAAYLRDPQTGLLTVLGVPVVMNTAVTTGQFLVIDTGNVGFVADRKAQTLEFSRENGDNFEKDLITVKASERIANVIERHNAGIYGTFSTAAGFLETP